MNWDDLDWNALARLRAAFLSGTAGTQDYWQAESDLASYDATFAQRIGWKWDYVLAELQHRGWSPPGGELLDWGCGSGIAGRAFLDVFGPDALSSLRLWDRSALAMQFAAKRARAKYPGLEVNLGLERRSPTRHDPNPADDLHAGSEADAPITTLLLSHVLTELTQPQTEELVNFTATAECVIWVEPGTYETSLTLIAIRERLRSRFNLVAPCPHQVRCGILSPGNERHWCHHFATPPPFVFTDRDWARFANLMNIDLRDLALSFLVLDRRPAPELPAGTTRVIGHPRLYKPHALLLSCDATGVRERRLTRRAAPEEFKRLKKGDSDPLRVLRCDGDEIVETRPL